jgi:hypothetical protein
MAVLAFVAVLGGLFGVVYALGGQTGKSPLASVAVAEAALKTIQTDLGEVFAPGVDLVVGDPHKAMGLLTDAWGAVGAADEANVPPATLDPLRNQVADGLDRLFHVVGRRCDRTPFQATRSGDLQSLVRGGRDAVRHRQGHLVGVPDRPWAKKANLIFRAKSHAAGFEASGSSRPAGATS